MDVILVMRKLECGDSFRSDSDSNTNGNGFTQIKSADDPTICMTNIPLAHRNTIGLGRFYSGKTNICCYYKTTLSTVFTNTA